MPTASAFNPLSLSAELDQKLEEKQFLPTTQFFAASEWLKIGQFLVSGSLRARLQELLFQERTQRQLREGEFSVVETRVCKEKMSLEIMPTECLWIQDFDPHNNTVAGPILVATQSNPARPEHNKVIGLFDQSTSRVLQAYPLKPFLLAQTVGHQPILQKKTPLSEMPAACLQAVLAIEDTSFLEHSGVSITGTLRALLKNVVSGRKAQGGSTITQQLVKNYFLTPERTYTRKAQEILLSVLLESRYTKDQILETYLNIIYMAQNGSYQVLGFPAAAEYYFSKSIEYLEPHECALLAAVLNGPGPYNPFKNPEKALSRRNLVLDKMRDQKFLTDKQYQQAKEKGLPAQAPALAGETSPYFLEAARQQIESWGETLAEKRVLLTLDVQAQNQAQRVLQAHLNQLEKENRFVSQIKEREKKSLEGLFLSNDREGRVLVAVGGRNFRQSQFNRITRSHRQIGSLIKPFVYLTAIDKGYEPQDPIQDEKFQIPLAGKKIWSPENYDKKFWGTVPLYFALKNSLNASTAKLGLDVGLESILSNLNSAGIQSEIPVVPAMTLGAAELTPLEVLQAYFSLSQMGDNKSLRFVEGIWDPRGPFSFAEKLTRPAGLKSPAAAAITIGMMKQTLISGTAASAGARGLRNFWAGKTGTTSDYKDSWFAGFSPFETSVAWVGYDDNTASKLTGAGGALPIWADYTLWSKERFSEEDFSWPDDVEEKVFTSSDLKALGFPLETEANLKLIVKKKP